MKSISGWNILLYYNTDKYWQLLHGGEFIISLFHANVFPIQSTCIYLDSRVIFLRYGLMLYHHFNISRKLSTKCQHQSKIVDNVMTIYQILSHTDFTWHKYSNEQYNLWWKVSLSLLIPCLLSDNPQYNPLMLVSKNPR